MNSTQEPATLKKPPPFQRCYAINGSLPPSPSSHYTEADFILPAGNELILCSVYDRTRGINDPIPLINTVIDELSCTHEHLNDIPVIVKPFDNRGNAPLTTVCYLRLHPSFDSSMMQDADDELRYDLLNNWQCALKEARPQWEVCWQPQKSSSDKRLWLRFPDFPLMKSGDPLDKSISKIKSHLHNKGYTVTNHFSNAGGTVFVLSDHSHMDKILTEGTLSVPAVSRQALRVYHGRQIEILEAFELVILGISKYEGISFHLTEWLTNQFYDGAGAATCFVHSCIPEDEPDAFIFHMCDWKSTTAVLRAKTNFLNAFWMLNLSPLHNYYGG